MKTMHARLQLSTNLTVRTRDRCPDVVFTVDDEEIAAIRTDTELPRLPIDDGGLGELVLHDDVLSRVIDEEAWLHELARSVALGGKLRFTLPAAGALAWLDTMNAYRYFADITGRGHAPDAALPTGWNRHYTCDHIRQLLTDAGFTAPDIHTQSYAMQEIHLLAGMLRDNWIRQDRLAESRLFPQFGHRDPTRKSSVIVTTWSVIAHKTQ